MNLTNECMPYSTEQLARIIAFFADLHLARRFPLPDDVAECCEWAREYLKIHNDATPQHDFTIDELWPTYSCVICGKSEAEHNDTG